MSKKNLKVPFYKDGRLFTGLYPNYNPKTMGNVVDFKDNYIFEATIKFHKRIPKDWHHNELYIFIDNNNNEYRMFPSDIMECMEIMCYGRLEGKFTFTCKSGCYGIKYLGPKDNNACDSHIEHTNNTITVY